MADDVDVWYENYRVHRYTIMERIQRQTIYRDNGCWEYHGRGNQHGYGQEIYQGKPQLVTHIVWRIMKGKIRGDLCVLHHCDNPRCYNPDHLFLGTRTDNHRDMMNKGRNYGGANNPRIPRIRLNVQSSPPKGPVYRRF